LAEEGGRAAACRIEMEIERKKKTKRIEKKRLIFQEKRL
jgi:hypothetical protein